MGAMEIISIIMQLLGGVGTFLVGMKILSENMTRLAHSKLKTMLNKTANNRFAGVGIGAAVTVIGQSSALTTVMVVGLVNAGIMTLFQATSIIMGANIGTTFTAWLLSLSGFSGRELDITIFKLCLTAVGMFMTMFSKKEKVKTAGSAIAALGLIFVGLKFVSSAIDFGNEGIKDAVTGILSKVTFPLLLLLIGIVITALVQSSMAVTAIIIAMTSAGLTIGGDGNAALFIIIGSNIGTCITALISSLGANTAAKRAALIHFMFNFFGAIIFTVILWAWKNFSAVLLEPVFPTNKSMQIAMFHTLFNVVNALLFLPFVKGFVWLAEHIVPTGKSEKSPAQAHALLFGELDDRLLRSPSVALGYLYQETGKVFSFAMNTLNASFDAFLEKNMAATADIQAQNHELAEANKRGVSYLVKLSASSLVMSDEKMVSALHYVLNDIMRVGELADNVTKYTRHYVDDGLVFSDEFLDGLKAMHGKVKKLYMLSLAIFLFRDSGKLKELDALEDEIDSDRRELIDRHIERLNEGKCQPQNSSVFINLVGNLERAADHITYIAHSIE